MNNIDIVIPWRNSGCKYRLKHFNFLRNYYSKIGNVIISDSQKKIFNRSEARNAGVNKCSAKNIMIVDADNYISKKQINLSIDMLNKNNCIIRPFSYICYLNESATKRFYKEKDKFIFNDYDYDYMHPSIISLENSGGSYITTKDIWNKSGGMDEEFEGWGLEDLAFNMMCKAKSIKQKFIEGPNYHLYHPAERKLSENNSDRYIMWYQSGRIYKNV